MTIRLPWTPRAHRARWAGTRTLTDLGRLTADWLEGTLRHHPGYPGAGPDPETEPLVPVLARLNRAGLVTSNSQPGHAPETGWDGAVYAQRAAVDGWTADRTLLGVLIRAALDHDLHVVVHPPGPAVDRGRIPVTCRNGTAVTWFGDSYHPDDLAAVWPGIHPDALAALTSAVHVTLADTTWGSSTRLWTILGDRTSPSRLGARSR
ncbi:DUF6919 domain-containing protein [Streptomyces sp. NPDC059578]|uniref:DUF6919 domain-containing protein n=1 Tax=Streptomyces sp. NPDC059578 TaxID=3346874 RepID=UPI0036807DA0